MRWARLRVHFIPAFETKVLDKKLSNTKPDRGVITVETIAYNQRGEKVLSFKRRVLVPTKEFDEARQQAWDEKIARLRDINEGGTKL